MRPSSYSCFEKLIDPECGCIIGSKILNRRLKRLFFLIQKTLAMKPGLTHINHYKTEYIRQFYLGSGLFLGLGSLCPLTFVLSPLRSIPSSCRNLSICSKFRNARWYGRKHYMMVHHFAHPCSGRGSVLVFCFRYRLW